MSPTDDDGDKARADADARPGGSAAAAPESGGGDREDLSPDELREVWTLLSHADRVAGFRLLPREEAEDFFFSLSARDQAELVLALPSERRSWVRLLAPDDVADLVQAAPEEERQGLLALLDEQTRKEATALLAYAEDEAGGLMSPRYARVRPDMSVDEALAYLRKQARGRVETLYYTYVLDAEQRLLGVVSFRELFAADPARKVRDVMSEATITVAETMGQEGVSRVFAQHKLMAIPVLDAAGRMKVAQAAE